MIVCILDNSMHFASSPERLYQRQRDTWECLRSWASDPSSSLWTQKHTECFLMQNCWVIKINGRKYGSEHFTEIPRCSKCNEIADFNVGDCVISVTIWSKFYVSFLRLETRSFKIHANQIEVKRAGSNCVLCHRFQFVIGLAFGLAFGHNNCNIFYKWILL